MTLIEKAQLFAEAERLTKYGKESGLFGINEFAGFARDSVAFGMKTGLISLKPEVQPVIDYKPVQRALHDLKCDHCKKDFQSPREKQRFCSLRCAGEVGRLNRAKNKIEAQQRKGE